MKNFCVDNKWHHYDCKYRKHLHKKYKDFQFSMAKNWKASEVWDMVQNVCEKTAKNIDFVENRIPLEEIRKLLFADILA